MTIDAIAALWSQGRSLLEIGDALGVSRGKVAGTIHRARLVWDDRIKPRPPKPRKPSQAKRGRKKPSVVASPGRDRRAVACRCCRAAAIWLA